MKKSKVIIPALGVLILSTAASVTGTVAWFTANRKANFTAGNFAVVKTTTDLKYQLTPGVGTAVNNNGTAEDLTDDYIELADAYVELTDASFDHINEKIVAPDADGSKVGKSTTLDKSTASANISTLATAIKRATYDDAESHTHSVYSAVTWTVDFSVDYTTAGTNSGLFFDLTQTKFTLPNGNALSTTDAGVGFRLAFIPFTSADAGNNVYQTGEKRVLARAQTGTWDHDGNGETAAVNKVRYIGGNAAVNASLASSATDYASPVLIDSAAATTIPDDNSTATTAAAAMNIYLGKFTAVAAKTVHLQFCVVGWFEGTDPTVVNSSALAELVKASLYFELRTLTD